MAPGRSKIVEHYIMPEDTEGNFKALCRHCNRSIACSRKALSNLHAHIKVIHLLKMCNFDWFNLMSHELSDRHVYLSLFQRVHPALFESMPRVKKSSPTHARPLQSPTLLTNAIAENIVPLSLLESPSFKRFCQTLDPDLTVPTRKTLSGHINSPCWDGAQPVSSEVASSMF